MERVEERIQEQEALVVNAHERAEVKQREYEYLQYLWGIRHRHPHKIAKQDVKWMIITRLLIASIMGLLSLAVQCLGRCEPLSFLLVLLILKNWKYIILRNEKFLMTWLTITSMCLDFVWISFAAGQASLINYLDLPAVAILTYIMLVVKAVLLFYLIIIEKSFMLSGEESPAK
jgi:hypothetical protein